MTRKHDSGTVRPLTPEEAEDIRTGNTPDLLPDSDLPGWADTLGKCEVCKEPTDGARFCSMACFVTINGD